MKVAIYCRLSEEDRNKQTETDDSNSIQNQKSMLLEYALERGWEVYNIYSDDDYAGADRNRPQFKHLLADAEQRKFDIILCKTQSRFTRELELVEKYIHGLFPVWGIRFLGVVDNADTANKGNKKSRQINGLVNEWYLEDMSENIRSVLVNRRKNGYHIGSFALYGYKKDPELKGHLIIDHEAAKIVREVFTLFVQGYGKMSIARLLNDRGIPNPTEYKRLCGLRYKQAKSKNSTLWNYYAIADMLVNEIYIGNLVQGKYGSVSYKTKQNKPRPRSEWYIVEGTHDGIIDKELWDRVQALVQQKAKPFNDTGTIGLFARKAKCAYCGYTMSSSKSRGKRYLKCPKRHAAKDSCIGAFISCDKLEQLIIGELNYLADEFLDKDELERNIELGGGLLGEKKRLCADIEIYERKIADYAKIFKEMYVDKIKGMISEKDFYELSKDFTKEKERLGRFVTDVKKQLNEIEKKMEAGDNRRELIEQYTNIESLNREIVETLIDYVAIGKRVSGKDTDTPIEIHWNF